MNQSRGFYLVAAPVAVLLLLGVGARFLVPTASDAAGVPQAASTPRKGTSAAASPAPAKPADAATQHLLEKAVGSQIAALRKKDYAAALHFAAASYRTSTTPEYFGHMIEVGYAPLTTSVRVMFLPARQSAGVAVLPATVIDKAGIKTQYLYVLAKDNKAGSGWLIDACQQLSPSGPHPEPTPIDEREI